MAVSRITMTGTQVYGPTTPESDIDIVMLLSEANDFADALSEQGIDTYQTEIQGTYGAAGGFYYDIGILKFNIIIATDMYELLVWKIATDKMKRVEHIHDRGQRLMHFQSLFMNTTVEFSRAAFDESLDKGEDPEIPAIRCLECANLHEVLQHELQEAAMFQTALEQIVEEDSDYMNNAVDGGEQNPAESFAGKTAKEVLDAHAASNEKFDHRNDPLLPEPLAGDDDDIPF